MLKLNFSTPPFSSHAESYFFDYALFPAMLKLTLLITSQSSHDKIYLLATPFSGYADVYFIIEYTSIQPCWNLLFWQCPLPAMLTLTFWLCPFPDMLQISFWTTLFLPFWDWLYWLYLFPDMLKLTLFLARYLFTTQPNWSPNYSVLVKCVFQNEKH
jgi:hypothetical protein